MVAIQIVGYKMLAKIGEADEEEVSENNIDKERRGKVEAGQDFLSGDSESRTD